MPKKLLITVLIFLTAPAALAVNLGLGRASRPLLIGPRVVQTTISPTSAVKRSCESIFTSTSSSELPALVRLERAIKSETRAVLNGRPPHRLIQNDGEVTFEVGMLWAERPETLKALGQAISEGKINRLELGIITGPKVLKWLLRKIDQIPESHRMIITGEACGACMASGRREAIAASKALEPGEKLDRGDGWNRRDQIDFTEGLKRLGIQDAGLKMFNSLLPEKWGNMDLSYDSARPYEIEWSVSRRPSLGGY